MQITIVRIKLMPTSIFNSSFTVRRKKGAADHQLQNGFSYIEVVLSLFLVLAMLTILFTSSGTLWTRRKSNLQSIAAKIASREIESLRNTDFASLPSTGSLSDPDLAKLPTGAATRTVSNYGSPPDPTIKLITINVTWTERDISQEISLDTLISENGL